MGDAESTGTGTNGSQGDPDRRQVAHLDGDQGESPGGFAGVIVALGASAGGLDALDRFFTTLPPLDDTAFVVIQHLAPEHKTMMDTLLARHTKMNVLVASDGVALEGGHVYVIPPGTTMTVSHGRLRLVPRPSTGVTLPIDAFFESLALEAARRSIGIVLSGTGSDGSRGVTALDEAGAWVMVQDPETARFDGMPRNAIASGAVDHVLSPEMLAAEVASLVASGEGPPPRPPGPRLAADEVSFEPVLRMLGSTMRVDFSQYKPTTVLRRVERRMHSTGMDSIQAYADHLVSHPAEIDTLRRELLIPVTRFFRDPEAFSALRSALEPMMLARAAQPDRPFRCWVTPTSTGEEAYSLTMVLLELIEEHTPGIDLKVFATDVESTYLDRASAGVYTSEQMSNVPAGMRERWFDQIDPDTWRVRQFLRQKIVFSRHDLLVDAPFTQLDLVSCRNLLIYLRPAAQERAVRRLSYALRPGGLLFLGSSETPGSSADDYDAVDTRQKVYRLRRRPVSLPPDDLLSGQFGSTRVFRDRSAGRTEGVPVRTPQQRALEVLSQRYAPAAMVVNSDRELVHVIGEMGEILRIGAGDISLDVMKLLPPPLTPVVATLIHGAVRERAPQRSRALPVTLDDGSGGTRSRTFRIAVWPLHEDGPHVDHLMVCFEPADQRPPTVEADVEETDLAQMRSRHVDDLERELALTRANLQDTIQELGTANEELQATNEELMASNEELQSTNEELQSVNEELHTVNAEYQSKIAELNDANADLESLTRATRIPLVFVDSALRLTRFTPAATSLFKFRNSDVGRPITDFSHDLDYPDLYERVEAALTDIAPLQREVSDAAGRSWLVTVLPYTPRDPRDTRVVITCVDVSSMRDVARLQAVLDALPEHVAVLDHRGVIQQVNRSWREFAERNGDDGMLSSGPGIDYLDVCRSAVSIDPGVRRIVEGLSGVLDGTRPSFMIHYPCHSPEERRWFLMHATPMTGGGCVITHFNVTGWLDPDSLPAIAGETT